ncbi:MAG: hypothetical protein AB1454_05855 [Candidatus Auribacterota bacterium]
MRREQSSYIADLLRHRNLSFDRGMSSKNILMDIDSADSSMVDTLYDCMKRYAFRLLLRDVIRFRQRFTPDMLTRFADRSAVDDYLPVLVALGIISRVAENEYALQKSHIESFGDTLEWFVAQIFEREFRSPAGWGIKLHNSGVGGDYDVLSSVENRLVYVEVKSSPPKHIDVQSVCELIRRINALAPHMAVLLVDTALRMGDKIVPLCEQAFRSFGQDGCVECLESELFHWKHCFYIVNAKPHLDGNLQKVIGDCLRHGGMQI